eukprot:3547410-Amphidinium_carterae.1
MPRCRHSWTARWIPSNGAWPLAHGAGDVISRFAHVEDPELYALRAAVMTSNPSALIHNRTPETL